MKDYAEIERAIADANLAKDRLYDIVCRLEELGEIRKAKSLMTLIYKIEEWQTK